MIIIFTKICDKIIARAQLGMGGARDGLLPMRNEELEAQRYRDNYLVYLGTWQ